MAYRRYVYLDDLSLLVCLTELVPETLEFALRFAKWLKDQMQLLRTRKKILMLMILLHG